MSHEGAAALLVDSLPWPGRGEGLGLDRTHTLGGGTWKCDVRFMQFGGAVFEEKKALKRNEIEYKGE